MRSKTGSKITGLSRGVLSTVGSRSRGGPPLFDTAGAGAQQQIIRTQLAPNQIKPDRKNPKTHSGKQIRQIADSILAFGFINPLVVSETGELIAGHGRYEAALLLGLKQVPVIVVTGLSPAKRRAYAIADNKIYENGGWDRERLAIEIPELADLLTAEGLDVSILGFEPAEIGQLQTDFEKDSSDPEDAVDPSWANAPPVTEPGDLWILGNHRLRCGDARDPGHVGGLMRPSTRFSCDHQRRVARCRWRPSPNGRRRPSSPYR